MPEQGNLKLEPGLNGNSYDGDLSDLLSEVRILLPAAQLLTAFLVTLPFSTGFSKIEQAERWIFLATFICSIISLVLLSAPAVQQRLTPLIDRERFKLFATRMSFAGIIPLSMALVLAVDLVVSEVFGHLVAVTMAILVMLLIGVFWWFLPRLIKPAVKT